MDATEKIKEIKKVFELFPNGEDEDVFEFDCIDALMRIERIIKKYVENMQFKISDGVIVSEDYGEINPNDLIWICALLNCFDYQNNINKDRIKLFEDVVKVYNDFIESKGYSIVDIIKFKNQIDESEEDLE